MLAEDLEAPDAAPRDRVECVGEVILEAQFPGRQSRISEEAARFFCA
jgi:hypothetical protein